MTKAELNNFNYLSNKSKQQEQTISQLVKIVANMNQRIIALENKQKENQYTLT